LSNSNNVKWIIALSVSIVMAFAGWTFAAVNGSKANNIDKNTVRIDRNTLDIGELKTQYGIISTKLEFITETVKEIKEVLKND